MLWFVLVLLIVTLVWALMATVPESQGFLPASERPMDLVDDGEHPTATTTTKSRALLKR